MKSIILFILISMLYSCSNKSNEAKEKLSNLGYQFTSDDFIRAISQKNKDVIQLFTQAEIDPNASNSNGMPVIMLAVTLNDLEIIDMLIKGKINIQNTWTYEKFKRINALQICSLFCKDPSIAEKLIQTGLDPNQKDEDGNNALMYAAIYSSPASYVKVLIQHGALAEIPTEHGPAKGNQAQLFMMLATLSEVFGLKNKANVSEMVTLLKNESNRICKEQKLSNCMPDPKLYSN